MKVYILSFFIGTLLMIFGAKAEVFLLGGGLFLWFWIKKKESLLILISMVLGSLWAYLYINYYYSEPLFINAHEKSIWLVKGTIVGLPQQDHAQSRFDFQAQQFCKASNCFERNALLRLGWFGKAREPVKSSETWQLLLQLKPLHGYNNPGSFDALKKYLHDHVRATGSVKSSPLNQKQQSTSLPRHFRFELLEQIKQAMHANPFAGMIAGLSIGFTGDITVEQWDVLRKTGTSHLLAISGLHIGLVSSLCFWLTNILWRRSRALLMFQPAQVAAAGAAMCGAFLYSALAGFAIPTQRALVMVCLLMSAILLRKSVTTDHTLLIALLVVLLMDPLASLTAGFWLSFLAVVLILYVMQHRVRPRGIWWKMGRLQWSVSLGMLPLSWIFFGQGSLIGFAANLIAIPWVGFIVVPSSLLGCLIAPIYAPAAEFFWTVAARAIAILWPYLDRLSRLSFAVWTESIYNTALGCLALLGIMWFLAPRAFPGRYCGLILLFPALFYHEASPQLGNARIHILDVGQGLSVVVRTHHHTLLYDTGPAYPNGYDAGQSIILPYLQWLGVKQIDKLVISHMDIDHSGGANSLLTHIKIAQIETSEPERLKEYHPDPCVQGLSWRWDGVDFRYLYPPLGFYGLNNDSSCVLQIQVREHRILLPGDIEKSAEGWLVDEQGSLLASEILLVPHHGSKTSSTERFIQAVQPKYAIFATGFLNRFNFPKPMIVERYQAQGAILLETQQSGMISFDLEPGRPLASPQQYRLHNHYWWKTLLR